MSERGARAGTRRRALFIAAAVAAAAFGAWLWFDGPKPGSERATAEAAVGRASSEESAPPAGEHAEPPKTFAATQSVAHEAPSAQAGYDPSVHPHPITPEHLRLYREQDLLDGAWQALKKKDFDKARELIRTHENEYAGVSPHMDEGLRLLADCMERPGPETRARAQQYYDTRTYSQMRRRIRRLCLEVVPEQ